MKESQRAKNAQKYIQDVMESAERVKVQVRDVGNYYSKNGGFKDIGKLAAALRNKDVEKQNEILKRI